MRGPATVLAPLAAWLALMVQAPAALASSNERVVVRVHVTDGPLEGIQAALADGLDLNDISADIEPVTAVSLEEVLGNRGTKEDVLSRIWVERTAEHDDVFVTDRQRDRVLIRRISAQHRPLAVRNEELSQIIRGVVEALLDGALVGVSVAEARSLVTPAPAPTPVKALAARPQLAQSLIRLGGRYEVMAYANGFKLRQRGLLAISLNAVRAKHSLGIRGLLGYSPFALPRSKLSATLDALVLRSELAAAWAPTDRVAAHLGVGGGADVTRLVPVANGSSAQLTDPVTLVLPALRCAFGASYAWRHGYAQLDVLLEAMPGRERYLALTSSGQQSVFSPWQFQPGVGLEIGFGDRL